MAYDGIISKNGVSAGDHVCALYLTPEEQLTAAVEYIRGGLSRGERCFYVCCEHTLDEFRAALKRGGIDVETEEARGAILLATKDSGHLEGGKFDPDKMIGLLEKAVADALSAGFKGLCAAGDMNWVLDGVPGTERLVEYEARLNRFYEASHALGLCLYNLKSITAWLRTSLSALKARCCLQILSTSYLNKRFHALRSLKK